MRETIRSARLSGTPRARSTAPARGHGRIRSMDSPRDRVAVSSRVAASLQSGRGKDPPSWSWRGERGRALYQNLSSIGSGDPRPSPRLVSPVKAKLTAPRRCSFAPLACAPNAYFHAARIPSPWRGRGSTSVRGGCAGTTKRRFGMFDASVVASRQRLVLAMAGRAGRRPATGDRVWLGACCARRLVAWREQGRGRL